jgi:hypothetical protein
VSKYRKALESQLQKERKAYLKADSEYDKKYALSAIYRLMKLLGYVKTSI